MEGRGRVDAVRTRSPAALAARLLAGFGLRAPLDVWNLDDDELARWAESIHGGRVFAEPRMVVRPFNVMAADVTSCYPLVAHHLDWWRYVTGERIRRREVTDALRRVCERAARDPAMALDPKLWHRFGVTLVEVDADGERFPVALDDPRRPDGRLEVVPVFCRGPGPPTLKPYARPGRRSGTILAMRRSRRCAATW